MLKRLLLVATLSLVSLEAQTATSQTPPEVSRQKEVKTYSLPPEKLAKAVAYAGARHRLYFAGFAYGVLVLAGVLAGRVAPRFRNLAEKASRRHILQAFIFVPLLLVTVDILSLPLALYDQHLALAYEQSIQGWGSWFWDWTKGELLQFALMGTVLWLMYGAIRRSPKRWWFYFWLISLPIIVFLMFITPVLIEPMFYQFSPLQAKQPALVTEIEKVVARGGLAIPPERMYEMKASEKLKSLNAYVAGIGVSKRVVVWDNTIHKMTVGQTLFVFGHEMGHYVLGHIWMGIGGTALLLLVFLWIGYHAMNWTLARWGAGWGIRGMDDWAGLPVLMLTLSICGFLANPVVNSFGRMLEHNADVYGLEVIHGIVPDSSQAAAQAFQILGEVSFSDPNPSEFIKLWLYDHPAVSERVRFAAEYDPWGRGEAAKYVK